MGGPAPAGGETGPERPAWGEGRSGGPVGLYRIAWHLHRAYYGEESLRAVREEIEPLLAHDLGERWKLDLLRVEALAAEGLRFWEGAGLLDVYRLRGEEWLAFRHLTFQEYGAARALAEMYKGDALNALGRLAGDDYAAAGLVAMARDGKVDEWERVEAAEALGRLGRVEEAAELLLTLARDGAVEAEVRERAAEALGWLGRATPQLLAGLRALAEEPGMPERARQAAREALERLEGMKWQSQCTPQREHRG